MASRTTHTLCYVNVRRLSPSLLDQTVSQAFQVLRAGLPCTALELEVGKERPDHALSGDLEDEVYHRKEGSAIAHRVKTRCPLAKNLWIAY